ncbi:hypothetical protein HanIR_Chr11g0557721 [Helianthus annuus]|nr:hypothetical protein HanIR_Chr11g0557721 [Helianthus annuus]
MQTNTVRHTEKQSLQRSGKCSSPAALGAVSNRRTLGTDGESWFCFNLPLPLIDSG